MSSYQDIAIVDKDSESCRLFATAVQEVSATASTRCFGNVEDLVQDPEGATPPELIFLEINLNKGDGFYALKYLKTTRNYKDIPIIIFSNSQDLQDIAEFYILGANRYFIKPVVYARFLEVLKHIITREMEILDVSDYDNFLITT